MITHVGLFEGYGGTSMAAEMVLGPLDTRLVSDIKPAARTLLDLRKPDAPNFGDITRAFPVDPATGDYLPVPDDMLELLDVAGAIDFASFSWPCQPHSSAGKRLGEADPRALWPNVARFIAATRPKILLGENVARITSNGELRRVVRSLADLGYVGAWRVLNASDVYAPHKRARCFVAAVDATAYTGSGGLPEHAQRDSGPIRGEDSTRGGDALRRGVRGEDRLTLLPTPSASSYGTNQGGAAGRTGPVRESLDTMARNGRFDIKLLPTPTQSMTTGAGTSGREGGLNLQTAALTLLPTPTQRDGKRGAGWGDLPGRPLSETIHRIEGTNWGVYAECIARWGAEFGREAPSPTQPGRTGLPVLAPPFVEWMQGLPEGWVTGVPGLTRNQQLSLLGDGVMPQQGAAAFRFLLDHLAERWAVAA